MAYDNIKSHNKPGLHSLSLEDTFLAKPYGGGIKLTSPSRPFKGLRSFKTSSFELLSSGTELEHQ